MHETVFSKEIIRVAKDKLKDLDTNSKIVCVNVRLSPLSHVRPDALRVTFLQMSASDGLDDTQLNIKSTEVELICKSCGKKCLIEQPVFICQHCHSKDFDVRQDKEFFIESVEIEKIKKA